MSRRNPEHTLCIIPARGGSKRIPRKNIVEFKGRPIIGYSIDAVQRSGIASEIMVSTEDEEIAEIARECGAEVPFLRSMETADDRTGIADVLLEVIEQYREMGRDFKYIVCVLPASPLLQADKLRDAFCLLQKDEKADSICSVHAFSYPPQRALVVENGRLRMMHPENYFERTQDLTPIYHDCGQFFIFRTGALIRDKKLYTENMMPYYLDDIDTQDIDNWEDLRMAEIKYDVLKERGIL